MLFLTLKKCQFVSLIIIIGQIFLIYLNFQFPNLLYINSLKNILLISFILLKNIKKIKKIINFESQFSDEHTLLTYRC
jgi:hypothetical protein